MMCVLSMIDGMAVENGLCIAFRCDVMRGIAIGNVGG